MNAQLMLYINTAGFRAAATSTRSLPFIRAQPFQNATIMTIKLTDRQQQILDLIRQAVQRTGFPPTRAEIAQTLGFRSANAAEDHLRALARKGVVELTAGASRGIRLTDLAREALSDRDEDLDDQADYARGADGSSLRPASGIGQWPWVRLLNYGCSGGQQVVLLRQVRGRGCLEVVRQARVISSSHRPTSSNGVGIGA